MPIKATCPECDKAYTLADTMAGKSVKCKDCGKPFTVKAAANGIAARPSNGKVVKAARNDDDEDDEVVAAPKKKGGVGKFLLIAGGLVAVLMLFVCGGVGIGGFLLYRSFNSPDDSSPSVSTSSDKDKDKDRDKVNDPNKDKNKDKDKVNNPQDPPKAVTITLPLFQQVKAGMAMDQVEGVLGKPFTKFTLGDGKTTTAAWVSRSNSVNVTFVNNKVDSWSGVFDNKLYGPYRADTPGGPGTNPDMIKITKANFDQIRGGMTRAEVRAILGQPNLGGAPLDPATAAVVGDKGSKDIWSNTVDNIAVDFNASGQAARWTLFINGKLEEKKNDAFTVKPASSGAITKENYDKIMGGETEDQLKALLGKIANMNGPTDPESAKYDEKKLHVRTWMDSKGVVTVAFCDGKAAHWTGVIDGKVMEAKTNQQYAILKKDLPVPTTQVTKANYDLIMKNMNEVAVGLVLGKPSFISPRETFRATKTLPAHQRFHAKWSDGQGGDVTIHFIDFGAGATVDRKETNNRLK